MNVLAQDRELVRWPLGHDEALATETNQQGHRPYTNPLGPLVRAHACELLKHSPQIVYLTQPKEPNP